MTRRSPWWICGLLFLATLLNYLDRQTISVSATVIADEMKLTDEHLGRLFFAFLFAYGIAQLFVGSLLDRIGTRVAYAAAVVLWSLAGASAALATGFASLFQLRVLLGICESPNWPLALRTVARVFPPEQRALATGIFQSGTSFGALIAPPTIIWLTQLHGWRFAFVIVGALGLVWAALWLAWFHWRPDPRVELVTDHSDAGDLSSPVVAATPSTFAGIVRSRTFWGLMLATSFLNPLQYFYTTWLPRYFDKYAGVGFGSELAQRLVIVYLALDLGLLSGGATVTALARTMSVTAARQLVTSIGALAMLPVALVAQLGSLNTVTAVICLATFGLGWFMVNYLAFTSEVSARKTSTAAGLLGGAGSLAGAGFMLLVGKSIEQSQSFSIAFVMAGLMPLVALAGIWISTSRGRAAPPLD